ncbi:MAG: hypothetical protein H8E26_04165 [FCB group bacterium]|nr:hypothetical protein [FCB group bacterium]MBL7028056.1 hypothetical protein [Candidatus Neomarinimicrobiota bacterium]MBL7122794.1 hypothetical protein [Candidatus Neomarinimicrobiota bacterium]
MNSLLKIVVTLSMLVLLLGCAVTYRPMNASGGYSENQLNENTFEVTFEGNQYNSLDEVRTYLTFRCAELTLEQGLTHFLIVEDASYEAVGDKEFADGDLTIETRTSMSGGVNTTVRSTFGAEAMVGNPIGKFIIMMRVGPDPVHTTASMDAKQFIEANNHLIKR